MRLISRREFLGTMAVAAPGLAEATGQSTRTFAWVNTRPLDNYPVGVRHATFYSPSNRATVGYCIFLPPDYEAPSNSTRRYPVVYALHGGLVGSEVSAVGAATFFDAPMRQGRVSPAIYVFPNGGRVSHYDYPALDSYGETAFVRELIPHIDRTYRTVARREARGLEGFSAGGRGVARVMFKYPAVFGSAVPMSGGHQHEKYIKEHQGRSQVPPDCVFEPDNNTYDLARGYARQKQSRVHILVVVGTEDPNYEANLDWMKHLNSLGIEHERILVEGVGHNYPRLAERVGLEVMRFHGENLGRSAVGPTGGARERSECSNACITRGAA